ncbi:hypothetical protein PTSG_04347 [Salpingoeca rosetta]|uniref:Uncharacterized protein n=1 Tax=Salpingoeca rosetta (strain ATCC 50818 / BSB-021) TaxID=946362 RepID=F2U8A4_SALR5|nr:uncharacterized protein PTSG_04347 [Salpingoeca rosetta]EGD72612.1 hypothetical protein PTSG_04347 [Salpingoeca rosetta]|eukprot:XP_004994435.1 hypothetical protein PTSG_04347 [Salpingoeca rosetta]
MLQTTTTTTTMMRAVAVVLAALIAVVGVVAEAAHLPPAWAMNGEFGQSMQHLLTDVKGSPLYFDFFLDHFDHSSPTFRGRYYIDDSQFKNGSVCFFYMGGEGPNTGIRNDYVSYLAKQYKALIVSIEHRFYGDSVPFDDFSVTNLEYLTSRQALADAAQLIKHVNSSDTYKCSAWFAFGGSYSGALSAWFRVKYPDVIVGSLSSSGVVNAILDFTAFDVQVRNAIGFSCTKDLQRVTAAFETALNKSDKSNAHAKALFSVRADIPDGDFAYMLADSAAMADQYGSKEKLCSAISGLRNEKDDEIVMQTFANFTIKFWGADFGPSCFYDSECVRSNPAAWQPTARSWWWQKCHELAYWQNAPVVNSLRMSLLSMNYHKQRCEFMFAKGVFPDTQGTNKYYGGKHPNGTNIFFSDFSDDPWQQASVRTTLSPALPYELVTCNGCGHCMDLHAPDDENDPNALKQGRVAFEKHLSTWLKPYTTTN